MKQLTSNGGKQHFLKLSAAGKRVYPNPTPFFHLAQQLWLVIGPALVPAAAAGVVTKAQHTTHRT